MTALRFALLGTLILGASLSGQPAGQAPKTKALVGGTLVDGFAGPPIQNSVILIDGDRISAVGQ
ncbi:MAG TPA: hypothetical protein VEL51_20085, partial [Vicinamibacterales bacterium]|nr:hypothetical protein [Vicinamibacterales bacterium]